MVLNLLIRKHPQKLNIQGVPGNLFIKAAARVGREKKKKDKTEAEGRGRDGTGWEGWGGGGVQ